MLQDCNRGIAWNVASALVVKSELSLNRCLLWFRCHRQSVLLDREIHPLASAVEVDRAPICSNLWLLGWSVTVIVCWS